MGEVPMIRLTRYAGIASTIRNAHRPSRTGCADAALLYGPPPLDASARAGRINHTLENRWAVVEACRTKSWLLVQECRVCKTESELLQVAQELSQDGIRIPSGLLLGV